MNHEVFVDYKNILKQQPQSSNFFRTAAEYINQLDLITDSNGMLYVDYIIKYENLTEELNSMFNYLKLTPFELPVINNSNHKKL